MTTNLLTALLLALSEVETGNKDNAISPSGARSRYGIMLEMWKAYTSRPFKHARIPQVSRTVATAILKDNHDLLRTLLWRDPDAAEMYILWLRGFGKYRRKPTPDMLARAQRFANIVEDNLKKSPALAGPKGKKQATGK